MEGSIEKNNEMFENLNETLNSNEILDNKGQVFAETYDFLDFFRDKENVISIRARHTDKDKYIITLAVEKNNPNIKKMNDLFTKAGFSFDLENKGRADEWKLEDENPEVLAEKIKDSKKIIFNEWDIEPTNGITENMSFNAVARIKRKQLGDTTLGRKKFDLWLKMKKIQLDAKMIKGIYKKYKQKKIFASGLQNADRRLKEAEKKLEEKEHENDGKEK